MLFPTKSGFLLSCSSQKAHWLGWELNRDLTLHPSRFLLFSILLKQLQGWSAQMYYSALAIQVVDTSSSPRNVSHNWNQKKLSIDYLALKHRSRRASTKTDALNMSNDRVPVLPNGLLSFLIILTSQPGKPSAKHENKPQYFVKYVKNHFLSTSGVTRHLSCCFLGSSF